MWLMLPSHSPSLGEVRETIKECFLEVHLQLTFSYIAQAPRYNTNCIVGAGPSHINHQ